MNRIRISALLAVVGLTVLVTFQNCSSTQFVSQSAPSTSPSAGAPLGNNTPPVEIVSFSSSVNSIMAGQSVRLSFQHRNADSLVINPGNINVLGQNFIDLSPNANITYSLVATNQGGSVTRTLSIIVQQAPAVISTFTASPASITSGQSSTLSFSGSNYTRLSIDPGNVDVTNAMSLVVNPTATTIYTLSAQNSAGNVVTRTVTVTVNAQPPTNPPVISLLAANPATISVSQSTTISWTATGATSLTLNPGNINVTGQTSRVVTPAATTTYTLLASNGTQSASRMVTVTVNAVQPAPTITSFTTSSAYFFSGEPVTLSWVVSGATTVTLNPGNVNVTGQTSRMVTPTASTTYILVATNASGQQVTRNVDALMIQPWIINAPISLTANSGTFDLNNTLPAGVRRGGSFMVDVSGTALPGGMSVSAGGILSAGTAPAGTSVDGVIFSYTEP